MIAEDGRAEYFLRARLPLLHPDRVLDLLQRWPNALALGPVDENGPVVVAELRQLPASPRAEQRYAGVRIALRSGQPLVHLRQPALRQRPGPGQMRKPSVAALGTLFEGVQGGASGPYRGSA